MRNVITLITTLAMLALPAISWSASSSRESKEKLIDSIIDLGGKTMRLDEGTVLSFAGKGMIINGTVEGNNSSILTGSIHPVFKDVTLMGKWTGCINDLMFDRYNNSDDDWRIISNIMKFNEITFSRKAYFLKKWESIAMNGGDVTIQGNGVRIFLPADKGDARTTIWGRRYNMECIFSSNTSGHRFEMNDFYFMDESGMMDGMGSDINAEKPVLYYYLAPTQSTIILNNVNSYGQGSLLEIYNFRQDIEEIRLVNCEIRTSQFAVEVANVKTDEQSGHTERIVFDSCIIKRYPNAILCGPVSLVGRDDGINYVSISNCTFEEANAGNIEISGVNHYSFNDNTCTNLFCYDGDRPPQDVECKGNIFNLRRVEVSKKSRSLSLGGKDISFIGNCINIMSKPHPFIDLLQPELVQRLVMKDNSINYIPSSNPAGFSCLFSIKKIKGEFVFMGNTFTSAYDNPQIDCNFPSNAHRFEDPSHGKIRIAWK